MDEDIDGIPLEKLSGSMKPDGGFIRSKWETVDPEQVINSRYLVDNCLSF